MNVMIQLVGLGLYGGFMLFWFFRNFSGQFCIFENFRQVYEISTKLPLLCGD